MSGGPWSWDEAGEEWLEGERAAAGAWAMARLRAAAGEREAELWDALAAVARPLPQDEAALRLPRAPASQPRHPQGQGRDGARDELFPPRSPITASASSASYVTETLGSLRPRSTSSLPAPQPPSSTPEAPGAAGAAGTGRTRVVGLSGGPGHSLRLYADGRSVALAETSPRLTSVFLAPADLLPI